MMWMRTMALGTVAACSMVAAAACGSAEGSEGEATDTASAELAIGPRCGDNVCGRGEFCCNESCGICAPRGGSCTQQVCSECETDKDCRAVADYCSGGCDCLALPIDQADIKHEGDNCVACFVDPCLGRSAVCAAGTCVLDGAM